MAKNKKKSAKTKKSAKSVSKAHSPKLSLNPNTDTRDISNGAMKDAFRQAFLRQEI